MKFFSSGNSLGIWIPKDISMISLMSKMSYLYSYLEYKKLTFPCIQHIQLKVKSYKKISKFIYIYKCTWNVFVFYSCLFSTRQWDKSGWIVTACKDIISLGFTLIFKLIFHFFIGTKLDISITSLLDLLCTIYEWRDIHGTHTLVQLWKWHISFLRL